MTALAARHDCLLLDLDGTLFRGSQPTVGAIETLATVGNPILYLTNNASRSAAEVAEHLRELGFTAKPDDVVTSAQAAARLLAAKLPADSAVLVVGTDALAGEVAAVGLRPVRQWSDSPVAVVQGYSPFTCWADLAEAGLAIRGDALWVAANVDVTLPSERGLLPGNGALVAALRAATDREPEIAGKPQPTIFRDALSRGDFRAALVIGDRLDTDLEGANAAQLPSLMVLTGVSTAEEAMFAPARQRPTYLANDLRALADSADRLRIAPQSGWRVALGPSEITVTAADQGGADDGLSIIRAVADAVWKEADAVERHPLAAGDDTAAAALRRAVAAGVLRSDSVNVP
ncbi:MAG TPA: HAD-IIA family hydrolase [Mycobacterium sp.]|jgi:HAD superfamily hydrolase (TIGR01450 family)